MAGLAYNNTKNITTSYIFFEFNCGYYFYISNKKDLDLYSRLKTAKK